MPLIRGEEMSNSGLFKSVFRSFAAITPVVFALAFTGSASASSPLRPLSDSNAFQIAPYLYSNGSGTLSLGWTYVQTVPAGGAQVEVYDGTTRIPSINAEFDGISWSAALPVPDCGFGTETSYQVKGMAEPVLIAPIPCPGSHDTARFSFIADAQEGPEFLQDIAAEMAQFPGSAILSDGDLVQNGATLSEWTAYFNALAPVASSRVMLAAMGNHEYRSTPETNYWQNFFRLKAPEAHYSVSLGDAHLIILNSNFEDDPTLIDSQLNWLQQELAVPAAWKIVMFHQAPYSSGFFDSELAPRKEYLRLREKYVPIFEAYRVDLVLSGHTHVFERSVKDGIQYLVAGPAGGKMGVLGAENPYSLKLFRQRTVTHFEVSEQSLRAVTLSIDGTILDDMNLSK
jgi:hypothetical protein